MINRKNVSFCSTDLLFQWGREYVLCTNKTQLTRQKKHFHGVREEAWRDNNDFVLVDFST